MALTDLDTLLEDAELRDVKQAFWKRCRMRFPAEVHPADPWRWRALPRTVDDPAPPGGALVCRTPFQGRSLLPPAQHPFATGRDDLL